MTGPVRPCARNITVRRCGRPCSTPPRLAKSTNGSGERGRRLDMTLLYGACNRLRHCNMKILANVADGVDADLECARTATARCRHLRPLAIEKARARSRNLDAHRTAQANWPGLKRLVERGTRGPKFCRKRQPLPRLRRRNHSVIYKPVMNACGSRHPAMQNKMKEIIRTA